jgi:hypothetical protein
MTCKGCWTAASPKRDRSDQRLLRARNLYFEGADVAVLAHGQVRIVGERDPERIAP